MKIIAKQIPPEYQESPLFLDSESWPENVFVFGNRDFNQHAEPLEGLRTALENIADVFDDMQHGNGWTNDLQYAIRCELPDEYARYYERPDRLRIVELANQYSECRSNEENDILCAALELFTGKSWSSGTIRGSCQGDWQEIIYPAEYGRDWLEEFETEYFNTGTEWIVDPDGDNVSVYAHGWSQDQIRTELAEAVGTTPDKIVLMELTGWSRTAVYTEVTPV